jgi:hypothetical protein
MFGGAVVRTRIPCRADAPLVVGCADGEDALDGLAEDAVPAPSESTVSADATAGMEAIAAPTPSATANAPTRPTDQTFFDHNSDSIARFIRLLTMAASLWKPQLLCAHPFDPAGR